MFHLGDVVYNFGEWNYYYDQFYEPFRNYAAPIFAILAITIPSFFPEPPKGMNPSPLSRAIFAERR